MSNKPVAWINLERWRDTSSYLEDCVADMKLESAGIVIPLYTHEYERPHNTVLVPCDKLAEMQAEIEALKKEAALQRLSDFTQEAESFDRTASHMAGEYVSYQKELTDEEIANTWDDVRKDATLKPSMKDMQDFARAILLKANEK